MIKCKERAKDVLFWPGIWKQIEQTVTKCEIYQQYQMSKTKEPMTMSALPSRPWQIVTTDLFHFKGCDYLLIVEYYSCFLKLQNYLPPLQSQSSAIPNLSLLFGRHGIPNVVRSDNGPQFSSDEFKQFSQQWGFSHISVSPYHPQANDLAEKSVQIVKRLLTKANETQSDPYLS